MIHKTFPTTPCTSNAAHERPDKKSRYVQKMTTAGSITAAVAIAQEWQESRRAGHNNQAKKLSLPLARDARHSHIIAEAIFLSLSLSAVKLL